MFEFNLPLSSYFPFRGKKLYTKYRNLNTPIFEHRNKTFHEKKMNVIFWRLQHFRLKTPFQPFTCFTACTRQFAWGANAQMHFIHSSFVSEPRSSCWSCTHSPKHISSYLHTFSIPFTKHLAVSKLVIVRESLLVAFWKFSC